MAFVGSLMTVVDANTSRFEKGMKRASKASKKLKAQLKTAGAGAMKYGGILGGIVVAALVAYTAKAFKAIDATAKLASEMDISTEALIGYQLAAGLAGADAATLNKSLQKMARIVGDARNGITTGTKALEPVRGAAPI